MQRKYTQIWNMTPYSKSLEIENTTQITEKIQLKIYNRS